MKGNEGRYREPDLIKYGYSEGLVPVCQKLVSKVTFIGFTKLPLHMGNIQLLKEFRAKDKDKGNI